MKKFDNFKWVLAGFVLFGMLGADTFQSNPAGTTQPGLNCQAVASFSDTADLPYVARAVYVGTGGNLAVELVNDNPGIETVFKNVASGSMLSLRVRRVRADNTTAADIVEIW